MTPQNDQDTREPLSNSTELVLENFYPNLRTKVVLLGNTITCLIMKSGARQHEWLSVYDFFSRLSMSLNSHMLRESTLFLPGSKTLAVETGTEHLPGGAIPLKKQMETERRDILDRCKALEASINHCYDGQAYVDLMEEARLELAELEAAIKDYESFEAQIMNCLSQDTDSKEVGI